MLSVKAFAEKLTPNLVPFTASKVETKVLWAAPETKDLIALKEACSYITQPYNPDSHKTFLAERYGGSGLQRNGGGARCGIAGEYQIKGIGANPLVGKGTSWRHANGALGVTEAIYEVIWGEILDDVLPFGAVKVKSILLTDHFIYNLSENKSPVDRRALIVRTPVIRPAHFSRAPYFQPKEEFSGQLMHDARRVRAVIRYLPSCLPQSQCALNSELRAKSEEQCLDGLIELARRLAWQLAYCRTRFLKITTSPSNVTIDGKLLDFNGLGCLFPTDHKNNFGYQLRLKEMIKEPIVLRKGLTDLTLYLEKYLYGSGFSKNASKKIELIFNETFEIACLHGYLSLLGIEFDTIATLSAIPEAFKNLVKSFIQLIDNCRFKLCDKPTDEKNMTMLELLVLQLYGGGSNEQINNNIYFKQLKKSLILARPYIKQKDSELLKLSLMRLQPRPGLSKTNMFCEIKKLLEDYSDDENEINQALENMLIKKKLFAREALGIIKVKGY